MKKTKPDRSSLLARVERLETLAVGESRILENVGKLATDNQDLIKSLEARFDAWADRPWWKRLLGVK